MVPLFSLGDHYVNGFPKPGEEPVGIVPIDIEYCPKCTLVQQKHTPSPEILYTGHYWYRSGTTTTMFNALANIVEDVQGLVELEQDDMVLDIGSNDGTLLRFYPEDVFKVGVEPANNMIEEGQEGIDLLICDLWSRKIFKQFTEDYGGKAKVITAIGMFYDLEDPNQFIKDVADSLTDEGLFVAQLMCLQNMLKTNDVGNFAHEHLEFYSFKSLEFLFYKNGLEIFDVLTNDINGESYRLYARKINANVQGRDGAAERIQKVRDAEKLDDAIGHYKSMFDRMESTRIETVDLLKRLRDEGKSVWIYGASTKGNTILQYYGIGRELIAGAADKSKEKVGRRTVGTDIPICSESFARNRNPDYFLVLPYAFIDEFIEREKHWRDGGGRFIVPLPTLRIV
tara:strand:+ start:10160 stop:11350 length:1191 start_codon:yes stop_codon:yes gene_type:complete